MNIIKQMAIIIGISLALGILNNIINPNGIAWVGTYKSVDDVSGIVADANAEEAVPADTSSTADNSDSILPNFDTEDVKIYEISLERAYKLYETKQAIFVDARYPADYEQGRIPGSINLPNDMFEDYYPDVGMLIGIDDPLVIFCSGPGCDLSALLADNLRYLGHTKLMIFEAGYPAWKAAGYPVEGAE